MQKGIRKSSGIITVAAAATPENLYLQSAAGQVPRHVILRKLRIYTNIGNVTVQVGTGLLAAWVVQFVPFRALNTLDNQWSELEIPERRLNGNLTVQSDILGCLVECEVEEIGA